LQLNYLPEGDKQAERSTQQNITQAWKQCPNWNAFLQDTPLGLGAKLFRLAVNLGLSLRGVQQTLYDAQVKHGAVWLPRCLAACITIHILQSFYLNNGCI
jgi:hypothetical protein